METILFQLKIMDKCPFCSYKTKILDEKNLLNIDWLVHSKLTHGAATLGFALEFCDKLEASEAVRDMYIEMLV